MPWGGDSRDLPRVCLQTREESGPQGTTHSSSLSWKKLPQKSIRLSKSHTTISGLTCLQPVPERRKAGPRGMGQGGATHKTSPTEAAGPLSPS